MVCDPLRLRRFLLWMVSFVWMGLIFWFSSQTSTESSASSDSVLSFFLRFFRIDDMERILHTSALHRFCTYILRKSAHLFLYTVLGGLFCVNISQYASTQLQRVVLPLSLGVLYACTDELHQYFVPGRACQVIDVCIDTAGVLLGMLVILGSTALYRRHKAKRTLTQSV